MAYCQYIAYYETKEDNFTRTIKCYGNGRIEAEWDAKELLQGQGIMDFKIINIEKSK
jgi:hypothetical protein